jgi:hypothetical protein
LRVSKFCESEMATKDTHLVLWSTRATPGISTSPEYMSKHERPRRSWEDNVEIFLTGTWREVVDWIYLVQDSVFCSEPVTNLQVHLKIWEFHD